MMETERKGSKTNLNESTMPLLEDQEAKQNQEEKEKIEMAETRSGDSQEKDDSAPEKDEKQGDGEEVKKEDEETSKPKEKKKEKKPKKEKGHKRTFSYANNLTVGLNLLDRDEKHINDDVNLVFEDIIAEPDASHGIDGVWKGAFILFSGTKQWVYKILAALIAFPLSLVWGLVFSIISLLSVWILTPVIRILDVVFAFIKTVLGTVFDSTLSPFFASLSKLCSSIRVNKYSTRRLLHEETVTEAV